MRRHTPIHAESDVNTEEGKVTADRLPSFVVDAEKVAQVAKIQYTQKILEQESLKKMSRIEGELSCG
ncbi:hypothetical protein HPB51_013894 [Rhipicephalus microplus]|uniref:Uncharacterized protein n=1 Tax=Rhipicephalus microplus TaxID=6941 RepID=A0A9J6EH55_RHIMP|nr:hypothetical protein HPB51_013894 [Rhipicephalus microplus]